MIIKHSTKERELAEVAPIVSCEEFGRLPEMSRRRALARVRGLRGERYVAHILDRHFHDSENHALIHDLRLPDGIGGHAQIDHVILSRLSRTASIIEEKNDAGRLSKNAHDEWAVWYEGRRKPIDIPNPLNQVTRQRKVLAAWLEHHEYDLAFEQIGRFVVVPPECAIDRTAVTRADRVFKADNLIDAWVEFGGISGWGKLFSAGISATALAAAGRKLAAAHQPLIKDPWQFLGLERPAALETQRVIQVDGDAGASSVHSRA